MSQWEAWTVTALGMAVVFIGLVACIVFIRIFSRVSQRVRWGEEGHGHGAPAAAVPATAPPDDHPPAEPVPADVLAVLAVVLEVERNFYLNRPSSRVTIRRPAPPK
jgi:Na+-transporting methylmalonyl-CoA/oxaloacetate decarboxylase gamma subunit